MTAKELVVLEQVAFDLRQGKLFYDDNQQGIGDYFFDSIIADIESLRLYAASTADNSDFTVCWLKDSLLRFITMFLKPPLLLLPYLI